jgi:hypothetical protein
MSLDAPGAARAQSEDVPAALEPQPPSPAEAAEELREVEEILQEAAPQESRELTPELRDVALVLPYLRPAQRRRARVLLARPPNANCGDCDDWNDASTGEKPFGSHWSVSETRRREVTETDRFRVHWVAPPENPGAEKGHSSSPEFAQRVADLLEQAAQVEHGTLGWPPPRPDGTRGGDGRVDVYLADVCDRHNPPCVFGFATTEPGDPSCNAPTYRCTGHLVLDNDFQEFKRPQRALQATIAHEYNHLLQFGIDVAQETWMFESTATWVEEHVFPDSDDWLHSYVRHWARGSRQSLTDDRAGRALRVYGSALWNHWLTDRFGAATILAAWQSSRLTRPRHWAAGAYSIAIRARGGRGFGPELVRFAAATSEWRSGGLPDHGSYPDVRRAGRLAVGGRSRRLLLDNTSYALFRVSAGGARRLVLRLRAPRGTRSGLALAGRRGRPRDGKVVKAVRYLPRGGRASVRLKGVRRLRRITAVVVNADARARGAPPGPRFYLRDDQPYRVSLNAG